MTPLALALGEVLLELLRLLGGRAARKVLGPTAGDYLKLMLNWCEDDRRMAGSSTAPTKRRGRRPNENNLGVVIRAAVASGPFQTQAGTLLEFIEKYQSIPGFPDPKETAGSGPGGVNWQEFFRKLVLRAYPPETSAGADVKWIVLPERQSGPPVECPGLLLRADYEIVPFHGREPELRALLDWCEAPERLALRCITGPGGMGKTRLGLEFCRRVHSAGWAAGFVKPDALVPERPKGRVAGVLKSPLLAIIDYAANYRPVLLEVLRRVSSSPAPRVRVLLLTRTAGEWWELAQEEAQVLGSLRGAFRESPLELSPVAANLTERQGLYDAALRAFADRLGKPVPKRREPTLKEGFFARILWLHMAALLRIGGAEKTGEYAILDEVLRRERRMWRKLGETFQVPPLLLRLLGRAVCVITATNGVSDRSEAVKLLRGIPGFRDQSESALENIAALLHECFPGERWIEPLQPDRLGDRLVELETDRNPALLSEFIPPEWRRKEG